VCAGNPFSLMDLSTVDVPSEISLWTWWFDTDPISNEQNPEMNWEVPGTYDVTLNVVSSHGCEADSTILDGITVYPKPSAGFLATSEAWAYDPTIEITNTASEDVTTWYYDFGDDTAEIFPEGNHLYENPGNYSVHQTVSNVFGCRDTASLSIVIHPEMLVYIPNAFTPDNNGHNELFIPVINGFEVTYYEFKVFNRWGTKVFSSNDLTEGWNGSFEGNMAEDGSYSWTLDIRSSTDVTIHRKMGNVMLLR